MNNTPTPHNSARKGDFAKTVLMPGDPLRAKFIAENFLENAVLVNNVRGIQGYTGEFNGKKVSVMASGMGMPSMAIYSYELFNFYDVDNIIRVGSAGAISNKLKIRDVVIGNSATTNSNFCQNMGLPQDYVATASEVLVKRAYEIAKRSNIDAKKGMLFSSDVFYNEEKLIERDDLLAVEMEAVALYANAFLAKKNAVAICTISDNLLTGESCSSEERQIGFVQMMKIALELV